MGSLKKPDANALKVPAVIEVYTQKLGRDKTYGELTAEVGEMLRRELSYAMNRDNCIWEAFMTSCSIKPPTVMIPPKLIARYKLIQCVDTPLEILLKSNMEGGEEDVDVKRGVQGYDQHSVIIGENFQKCTATC